MTPLKDKVDVLIVGAGPVGMSLAAELTRLQVSTLIVDRQPAGANTSRACVIHARTLEVLEPIEVTPALLKLGVTVPIFRIRDRDRTLASIDFSAIPSAYPYTLMLAQDRTEAVLLATLERLGTSVARPVEYVAHQSDAAGVVTTLRSDGRERAVKSRWIVGCDGMHSAVREHAGIAFEGAAYEDGFVLADVRMDWPLERDEVTLFYSPAGLVVVAPLPDDHFRIVAMDDAAPQSPSAAYVQALLDARGPQIGRVQVRALAWSSRFRIHHRVASSARRGRVLLCGDAAHVHSPAGGQGMNTGIQDAMALAPVLSRALRGADQGRDRRAHQAATPDANQGSNADANERELDAWAAARHRVAVDVVALTDRLTRMATVKSPIGQSLRNAAVALLGHVPPLRAAFARNLAELEGR